MAIVRAAVTAPDFVINYPPCGLNTRVQHEPLHMTEKADFMLSAVIVTIISQACALLSLIRMVPCPIKEELR